MAVEEVVIEAVALRAAVGDVAVEAVALILAFSIGNDGKWVMAAALEVAEESEGNGGCVAVVLRRCWCGGGGVARAAAIGIQSTVSKEGVSSSLIIAKSTEKN